MEVNMRFWIFKKIFGLKSVDEIEDPYIPDLTQDEVLKQSVKSEYSRSDGVSCSYCNKVAIGYETHTNCGVCVCEDHADKITLMLKEGYEIDLIKGKPHSTTQKNGMSYGGYRHFGGYRHRF
jgi:hypothetical protein